MDWLMAFATTSLGILLRIGIPLGFTILMVVLLKRLDESWQADVEEAAPAPRVKNPGCWLVNRCSPEQRAACDAYAHPEVPCWQFYRLKNDGLLLDRCLACKIFRGAPLPNPS